MSTVEGGLFVHRHVDADYFLASIIGVGMAQARREIGNPDTLLLESIDIHKPEDRGQGYGLQLFNEVVDYAERQDYAFLGASVANEQTGKFFAERFGAENLSFFKYVSKRDEYVRQGCSYEKIVEQMSIMRESMKNADPRDRDQLPSAVAYFLAPLACADVVL